MIEVDRCDDLKRSKLYKFLDEIEYEKVNITNETLRIAKKIIDLGILTQKSFDDCQHIALALENNCDCIVSWNFKHIVNLKTIRGVRAVSSIEGYKEIEIISPAVLLEREWIRFEEVNDKS